MENVKRFLITGANGLIGRAVVEEISPNFEWIGTYYSRKTPNMLHLDITNFKDVKRIFEETRPGYVIHCANLKGGLDFCEQNLELTKKFHFDGTVTIGRYCLEYKAKFIFISSECVFDGKKISYSESDEVNPISVYGIYKTQSEKWIQDNLKDYIIVRTMSVYGWDPGTITPNAIMKVYSAVVNEKKVFVPTFRWGNPTYVKDLAKAIKELCLSMESGIFHISGTSFINRYEWLKKTCDVLEWNSSLLIPQEDPSPSDILRPLRIKLNTGKFQRKFNTKLHSLDEALALLKQDLLSEKRFIEEVKI